MPLKVAIVYNEPLPDRYSELGESRAELGVLDEVKAVRQALDEAGYSVVPFPLRPPLRRVKEELLRLKKTGADVVFNLFEGFEGIPETEAAVAVMLEDLDFNFTGCPSAALKLALDKSAVRVLLRRAGVPAPDYRILNTENVASFDLGYPCIVKPLAEDASHGISEESVVSDFPSLKRQVEKISRFFGGKALVEEFLEGREFNITVIGNRRLVIPGISEIVYTLPPDKPRILTFEAKWQEDSLYFKNTRAVCPAVITPAEQKTITGIARRTFKLTGCRGYARVDFRQDAKGHLKVLEVNPNPDISPGSGAALQAAAGGWSYSQFILKIVRLALNYRKAA